jgi:hypothetical protein
MWILTFLLGAAAVISGCAAPSDEVGSTHAEALQLVLQKCGDRIQAAEVASAGPVRLGDEPWRYDTRKREWSVCRPVEPGYLDTTHTFDVIYSIDGKVAAAWLVDTRAGTVLEPSRELPGHFAVKP